MADFRPSDSCVWSAVRLAFISSRGGADRMPTAAEAWFRKPSQRPDPTLLGGRCICGQYMALIVCPMETHVPDTISLFAIWRFFIPSRAAICGMLRLERGRSNLTICVLSFRRGKTTTSGKIVRRQIQPYDLFFVVSLRRNDRKQQNRKVGDFLIQNN